MDNFGSFGLLNFPTHNGSVCAQGMVRARSSNTLAKVETLETQMMTLAVWGWKIPVDSTES